MKLRLLLFVYAAIFTFGAAAQTPPPARPAPIVSPEVQENGHVVFRLRAPQAKQVQVRGQWSKEPLALTANGEGVWSTEAADVPPGIWEYSFVVDGLAMIDPGNSAIKPMREPRTSILQIAGKPPQLWDFQDVPHGTVHVHGYLSKALQAPRELLVYTPPGYETGTARYPLLVLQHGSGDNQQTWVVHGKAHRILDNLIAAGKARPMIIVMLNGHAAAKLSFGDPGRRAEAMKLFQGELFEDALPLVESLYRVEPGAENRAIAGLSMGGAQSLTVGLGNIDRFSWIGSFSGVPPEDAILQPVLADAAGTNRKLRLLWIGVGKDDFLRTRNEEFVARLKESGIKHEWLLSEGAHAWPVWRGYLADFLPLIFQPSR